MSPLMIYFVLLKIKPIVLKSSLMVSGSNICPLCLERNNAVYLYQDIATPYSLVGVSQERR
jgi:hypothetical protein